MKASFSRSTVVSPAHHALQREVEAKQMEPAAADEGVLTPPPLSLSAMLVLAVRRLSDVELIEDRCFAQLVNEYTIVVIVLPSASHALSMGDGDGSRFRPWRGPDPGSTKEEDDESRRREQNDRDVHAYLDALLSLEGPAGEQGGGLRAALYECNRDEFAHPRTFRPEGSDGMPASASMASFGSFASAWSSSQSSLSRGLSSALTPSPANSPPLTPRPSSLQPPPSSAHLAHGLTDGRSVRQLSAHKAALHLHYIRLQALRFLLSSSPLLLTRPPLSEPIHQALSLAFGTAAVVYERYSPTGTPRAEFGSPSPALRPMSSTEARRVRSASNALTSPVMSPLMGFQLDETLDESATRELTGQQGEGEKAAEDAEDGTLLASGSSGLSHDPPPSQPHSPRVSDTPPPPSAAAIFAQRLLTAHMRSYCKAVYAALRREDAIVPLDDIRVALAQCTYYEEEIDLSGIQLDGADSLTPSAASSVDRPHKQLRQLLTVDFRLLEETDGVHVHAGAQEEAVQRKSASPSSILSFMSPPRTVKPATPEAHAAARFVERADDDDATREMRSVRLPLFLQLRAIVRPARSVTSPPTSPSSPSASAAAPLEMETVVGANTDLTRLSIIMLRYQRPDWWKSAQNDSADEDSLAGVQCVLAVRAWTLPEYSERVEGSQPGHLGHLPSQRERDNGTSGAANGSGGSPSSTPRAGTADAALSAVLYPRLPREVRPIVLRAFEQLQHTVTECAASLS